VNISELLKFVLFLKIHNIIVRKIDNFITIFAVDLRSNQQNEEKDVLFVASLQY